MKLHRWSLKARLLAAFGAMTVIVFLVGVTDFFIIRRISSTYNEIIEKNTKKQMVMLEMTLKVSTINTATKEAYALKDKAARALLVEKVHALHEDYKKTRAAYETIGLVSEENVIYGSLKQTWEVLEENSDKLMDFLIAGSEAGNAEFEKTLYAYNAADGEYSGFAEKLNILEKKSIEAQIDRVNTVRTWSEGISGGLVLLGIFLPLFLGIIFAKNISLALRQISSELFHGVNLLRGISSEMASSSNTLSGSTSEQAAALQETMSAVSEMAAMISKNFENTKNSQEESENSSSSATRGQEAVQSMLGSVQEIEESNVAIMNRIEISHREMSEIVQVINEIALKTKVINEIVFQTKLLSFNASVEAARAGEHGKGFAVVAEEVGNLAQMSGSAAKEITQLLDQSVQKVEGTVKRTRTEVEQMMAMGGQIVRKGIEGGQRCGEVLTEIVTSVNKVHLMLVEIAKASAEQAIGVKEIENAMTKLDDITLSNNSTANLTLANSQNLKAEADEIASVVEELNSLLNGSGLSHGKVANSELGSAMGFAPGNSTDSSAEIATGKSNNNFIDNSSDNPNGNETAFVKSMAVAAEKSVKSKALKSDNPKNVIKLKPNPVVTAKLEKPAMVSGGESIVPNQDDSRFEDV